jgi:Gti1/Pac2 family
MIEPTLTNVTIRSTKDAYQVFNAVANEYLPLISTRLTQEECGAIRSGHIYVWEERTSTVPRKAGIRRWTDGMDWGRRSTQGVCIKFISSRALYDYFTSRDSSAMSRSATVIQMTAIYTSRPPCE